jgi:formylglycine-generating enzyme required for sulfatase activity
LRSSVRLEDRAQREQAARVLLDYAGDVPEALVDVLPDVGMTLFPDYLKRLARSPESARRSLERLIAEPLAAWNDPPLDHSWTSPSPTLVARVEAAGGLVEPRFALCQTVPLDEFAGLAEQLRPCGYRPTRVRPYRDGPVVRVAAVWTRDGLGWSLSQDLGPDQVRTEAQRQRTLGRWPIDVAAYAVSGKEEGGTPVYAAVWAELGGSAEEPRTRPAIDYWNDPVRQGPGVSYELDLGRDDPARAKATRESLNAGQRPLTRHRLRSKAGGDWITQLWSMVQDHRQETPLPESGDAHSLERRLGHGACAWDLAMTRDRHAPFEPLYDSTFVSGDALECETPHGLAPEAHRARCLTLAREGYRPASMAAAGLAESGHVLTGSVWHRPAIGKGFLKPDDPQIRHAAAIAALALLGHAGPLWQALRHGPDPTIRSLLLSVTAASGIKPELLLARLDAKPEVSEQRALLLLLGSYPQDAIPDPVRQVLAERLLVRFTSDPDPGIHGAIDWLLRQWGQGEEIRRRERRLATASVPRNRNWYVNGQGQTFTVVRGPVTFEMGELARTEEGETRSPRHTVEIPRSFAMMTTEVTVAQFRPFVEALARRKPVEKRLRERDRYNWSDDCPMIRLDWFDAARYCNWLSSAEGIPRDQWCYEEKEDGAISMPENYLHRLGYRLPTEAEWEFACRAGAATEWPYGRDSVSALDLLQFYAWSSISGAGNRTHPVGMKMPNDLGLFDMLGNAHEWCQDPFDPATYHAQDPGVPRMDHEFPAGLVPEKKNRVLRGGWFNSPADGLRATMRSWDWASYINTQDGFRVARTVR